MQRKYQFKLSFVSHTRKENILLCNDLGQGGFVYIYYPR